MSFENETPTGLARDINKFFADEKAAREHKGETPVPKGMGSEDPNIRRAAEREYLQGLLLKPASALTPSETKFMTHQVSQFLQHPDDD